MFCIKCGNEIEGDIKFCTKCGASVPRAEEPQEDDTVSSNVSAQDSLPAQDAPVDATQPEPDTSDAHSNEVSTPDVTEVRDSYLPDSALEPSETFPSLGVSNAATSVMPQVDPVFQGGAAAATAPAKNNKLRNILIGLIVAAVVAIVAVLFAFGQFGGVQPIEAEAIDNEIIRTAVLNQLDTDGDGKLSSEETANVTALVYTPNGAQFVKNGDDYDPDAIRQSLTQNSSSNSTGGSSSSSSNGTSGQSGSSNTGSQKDSNNTASTTESNQDSTDPGADSSDDTDDTELNPGELPDLKEIVAIDANITSVNISGCPNLEYVDLRGNPNLATIDLSANKNISVLYCDPGVEITGLDEAGLYFTDLVSSIEVAPSFGEIISIEYDKNARPTSAMGMTYSYDSEGRLVEIKGVDDNNPNFNTFAYGENGLIVSYQNYTPLGVGEVPNDYYFGYDDAGNLTQVVADAYSNLTASLYEYADNKLVECKSNEGIVTFQTNEKGQVISSSSGESYTYDESGALTSFGQGSYTLTTTYTAEGFPEKTTVYADDGSSYDITYTCNSDGYITQVHWNNGSQSYDSFAGASATISYIKCVGSLKDRPANRYVPVFKVAAYENLMQGLYWSANQDWASSTADNPLVSFLLMSPIQTMTDHMGLTSLMPTNPNELKLAQYDQQHWADGLNISGAQPVDSAYQSLLDQIGQIDLAQPSAEIVDPGESNELSEPVEGQQ